MKNILLLLCISSFCYGMENCSELGQTTMPCNEKKTWYVDYVISIVSTIDFDVMVSDNIVIGGAINQTLEHLNKCSFEDGKPNSFIVSLLRIYEDPKQTLHLCSEQSHEKIRQELLKLGAAEGQWNCTQAMNKIKEVTGSE